MEIDISSKHKSFLDNWIQSGNITQSAVQAGYSKKTACAKGCQLLKDPRSKSYIEQIQKTIENSGKTTIAKTEEILEYLTRVMRGEEKDAFGLEVGIGERTRAALELNRVLGPIETTTERVIIVDGITRDSKRKN